MEAPAFFIAGYAKISDGLLDIMRGGLRRIIAMELPIIAELSAATILRCGFSLGKKEVKINLRDADGKIITSTVTEVTFKTS